MNQSTRGWGHSRGIHSNRRGRAQRVPESRLPGVLVASLGLAVLGATVMWAAVSTAEGANGLWRTPVKKSIKKPPFTLVSTVTSAAPAPRDSVASGRQSRDRNTLQTTPVTILRSEVVTGERQAPARSALNPTLQPKTGKLSNRGQSQAGAKPRGRLPRYFGKVGVSAIQKRRIYSIQAMYRERFETLTRQLETLRGQEQQEVLAVLTPLQKQRLSELIRTAEAAREARLRARKKEQSRSSGPTVSPGRVKSGPGGSPKP